MRAASDEGCRLCKILLRGITSKYADADAHAGSLEYWLGYSSASPGVYLRLKKSCDEWDNQVLGLQFFATGQVPDIAPAIRTANYIPQEPPQDFKIVRDWMRECESLHKDCQGTLVQQAPKRVLDVEQVAPHVVLVSLDPGNMPSYAALSHCWGKIQIITTTTKTYKQQLACIDFQHLSQTFKNAVMLCRALGIRYLWIDSLCIIQDDAQDWQAEAAKMASVYENARLVISATSAADGSVGCFGPRSSEPTLIYRAQDDVGAQIWVRDIISHHEFSELPFGYLKTPPLFKRAWCFQERLLATRIIHFTNAEMVWECKSGFDCECGEGSGSVGSNSTFHRIVSRTTSIVGRDSLAETIQQWWNLILDYTRREITNESDMLPALAGLATRFKETFPELGPYYAGLWGSQLENHLSWRSARASTACHRPTSGQLAPSFTWASRIGPIDSPWTESSHKPLFAIIDVSYTPKYPINPFGEASSGILTLRGRMVEARVQGVSSEIDAIQREHRFVSLQTDYSDWIARYWLDTAEDEDELQNLGYATVHCFLALDREPAKIYSSKVDGQIIFLLRNVDGNDTAYRRIGIAMLDFESNPFEREIEREVVIV